MGIWLGKYVPDTGMWLAQDAFKKEIIDDTDYESLLGRIQGE